MPLSETLWGLSLALSVTASVPALVPLVVGSKKTAIAQLAPTATLLPQAFTEPKSALLVPTLLMVSVAVPVLVRVTVWGRPEVPTYWLGNTMLGGLNLTAAPGGVLPVRITACEPPNPSLAIMTAPFLFPKAVGVNDTLI